MLKLIGAFLFLVFFTLSAIHIYWGLGGQWGMANAIPYDENGNNVLSPSPLASFVVAFGLLAMGIFMLLRSGLLVFTMPSLLMQVSGWLIAAIFFLRAIGDFKYVGFFKSVKQYSFALLDTYYYSPLCLVIAILMITIQLMASRSTSF